MNLYTHGLEKGSGDMKRTEPSRVKQFKKLTCQRRGRGSPVTPQDNPRYGAGAVYSRG